jgi:hypothetical protein
MPDPELVMLIFSIEVTLYLGRFITDVIEETKSTVQQKNIEIEEIPTTTDFHLLVVDLKMLLLQYKKSIGIIFG